MNEQPLAALLEAFPYTRYYPEWRLLTWHPRGVFDDALAKSGTFSKSQSIAVARLNR